MSTARNANAHRFQRGFTLAEILVTTAIFAIIMLAALAVYDRSNRVFKTSTESADMQQSTRIGFDKLVSDVRMAGFDYSRGGTPTDSWTVAQPDEQIEYAGPSALAFRANFDYNSGASTGNGLDNSYAPVNVNGQRIFPYVTTGNDEIVIYALRSNDSTQNINSLSFYVDDFKPRAGFPAAITPAAAPGNPSLPEAQLTLGPATCGTCGIDTSNNHPPYTLYRITVDDVLNNRMGTPVAENIRSLKFYYYTDPNGQTLLTNPPVPPAVIGTPITLVRDAGSATLVTANTGAIGGDGQYNPNSIGTTSNFADRAQRSLITSIRVDLIGMNSSPDLEGYTHPTETAAGIKNYRQYSLSSLVVPRNLGKTGFPEPSYQPPAPPTITSICVGHCGAPVLTWTLPAGGGPTELYRIEWDTSLTGAFTSFLNVTDPTQTSAILPDDGVSDVSQTYYYRMEAVNSNGSSIPSNFVTAAPQNRTKPSPPTGFVATDTSLGNAQPNQITLNWTSPVPNDTAMNTLVCTGTGGSTSAINIPQQEIIHYRIWRGTTPNFDTTNGLVVLGLYSPKQPPGTTPGSPVTWVDSTLTDSLPPANCVQYYYRIQAADRCEKTKNWNASGSQQDSVSPFYPPINGTPNAKPGYATSPNTPSTPQNLKFDTSPGPPAASGCPDPQNPALPTCRIVLLWDRVLTDTLGNGIGVDTYRITRASKHQNNLPANSYTPDPTFGVGGVMDVSGFSQTTGAQATWTDTTALVVDPTPPWVGALNSFEYTVAAKGCSTYSSPSNTADYPPACTINPTIIQAGASNPAASGDSPAQAWIMNASDTITVQAAVGSTLTTVKFDVTAYPAGTPVDSLTIAAPAPFVYTWSDRVDLQIYQIKITVTDSTGCQEIHIKYVQDQATAPCAFANQVPAAPSLSTGGATVTASNSFTIKNNGTDPMNFNVVSPAFQGNITVTWADPTAGLHPTLKATAIAYSNGAFNTTDNFSIPTPGPFTRAIPSGMTSVPAGATFTITVRFTYSKFEPALTSSPISKICLTYRIPSEPKSTKFCNLVGQSVSTNNPTGCD